MRRRALVLLVLSTLFLRSLPADEPPAPAKILLVVGGCCHDYEIQKRIIKKGLEERAYVEVDVVHQGGAATNAKIDLYKQDDWAKGYDLVIHDECFAEIKENEWTQRVLAPHKAGLPAVVVHCAMHCYRDGTEDWFAFCGVTSHGHGAHYAHEVLNTAGDHPVMQGFGAAWANPAGELYHVAKVWPNTTILGSSKSREDGKEHACVWANEYGEKKTRVFGTTLGHHNVTVEDPKFLGLLARGCLWAMDKPLDKFLKPREPKRVPINLALKKPTQAKSTQEGHPAEHLVDGDLGSRWCASGPQVDEWVQVDLEKPTAVKSAELAWEQPQLVYQYLLEGSLDGEKWTTLVDRRTTDKVHLEETFKPQEVRYVRLTGTGAPQGAWISLWELKLFGDATELVDPQTAIQQEEAALLADVKVPEGFEATLFAAPPAVQYPVFVAAAPDGTVYVSVDKNGSIDRESKRGAIYRLRDLDGDGRADEVKPFVVDVDSPRGLVWDRDRLYVMHPPHLSAYIDADGDGRAEEEMVLVKNLAFGFADRPADHTANGVTLGIDGFLYIAMGDFGFMEAEGTDGRKLQFRGGGVIRVRTDGTQLEVFSRGTRNIVEVAVDPLLNGFARDNTNDGDGWDIRLHHFTGLDDHGYPSLYKRFADEAIAPIGEYGGGSGCGACFIDEPGLPEGHSPALYTADWGRNWVYRHQLTPKGATFTADQNEFVGLTRVTDLDVDGNSNIYVTSWKGATFTYAGEDVGYLVRLKPKGYTAPKQLDYAKATDAELVAELKSPSHRRRLAAQRELIARGPKNASSKFVSVGASEETTAKLRTIANDPKIPLGGRVAAVFAGAFTDRLADNFDLLPFQARHCGDQPNPLAKEVFKLIRGIEPHSERGKIENLLTRSKCGANFSLNVAGFLSDEDPVVVHTAIQALAKIGAVSEPLAIVDQKGQSSPILGQALRVLGMRHQAFVVESLAQRLSKADSTHRRIAIFSALCRLHFREGPWKGDSWGTRPDTSGPYYQPETWEASERILEALQQALAKAEGDELVAMLAVAEKHKLPLEGDVSRLVAAAERNFQQAPAAIEALAKSERAPAFAAAFLRRVVESTEIAKEHRLTAARLLLQASDETNFPNAFESVVKLDDGQTEIKALRRAILDGATLGHHVRWLGDQTWRQDTLGRWSAAAIWRIVSPLGGASSEAIAQANDAMFRMTTDPNRRPQAIAGLEAADARERYEELLTAARAGDEPAKRLAERWELPVEPTASPAVKSRKPEDLVAEAFDLPGRVGHGAAIFAKLQCAKCHTIEPGEPLRGPYLPNVVKTYKRNQLAEAVLLPSKTLAQGFVTYVFALEDGRQLTGFVVGESPAEILVRDQQGKEHRLKTDDIEERTKSPLSIMPENLAAEISVAEFGSLLAYLESLGK